LVHVNYESTCSQVNDVLAQYSVTEFPALTLRQIYYRLVAKNAIPNKRSAYTGLSSMLVRAREAGRVDDTRIEDRSRGVLETVSMYPDPDTFTEDMKEAFKCLGEEYYADLWADQKYAVELWVEKDALSRVIARAAEPFRVVTCPSRGYSSYTYIKRVAVDGRFAKIPRDKKIVVLDFRDHDPSGIQMTQDLENRFIRYCDRTVQVKWVALTIEQVKRYNLIPNPTKLADLRTAAYVEQYGNEWWELDAIEPTELQKMVVSAIRTHVNMDAWKEALAQEYEDREGLIPRFKKVRISLPKN